MWEIRRNEVSQNVTPRSKQLLTQSPSFATKVTEVSDCIAFMVRTLAFGKFIVVPVFKGR